MRLCRSLSNGLLRHAGMRNLSGPQPRPGNTIAFRRALKQRTPEVSVRDEHTRNCRVLPDRLALLDHLPKGGTAAEVGVASGHFTRSILQRNQPRLLHLIDMWASERYSEGLDEVRVHNWAVFATDILQAHRGRSVDVLATFPDACFDWIYIDTDHSYETTIAELRTAAPKIKAGGFIAGHDFCTGNVIAPWPYGVVEACNQFCVEDGWQYRFIALDPRGYHSFGLSRL
jgi:predicted O-methyltransferase YrrM